MSEPKTKAKKSTVSSKASAKKSSKRRARSLNASEESAFWAIIEAAWTDESPEVNEARENLADRATGKDWRMEDQMALVDVALDKRVIRRIRRALEALPQEALMAFDRVLERKLYDIDRHEILCYTDDDENFLGARGHIVGLGKAFYDAVNEDPEMALCGFHCKAMTNLPQKVYTKRFGKYPGTGSNISRKSESNKAGWADCESDD